MFQIDRILCPVDFSDCSRRALQYAVAMGKWYGARVTALHVLPNLPVIATQPRFRGQGLTLRELDAAEVRGELAEFVEQTAGDIPVITDLVEAPDARAETLRQAEELHADLVVMGTHGRSGIERLLLGSVAERVARASNCPVMLVPPGAPDSKPVAVPFTQILCAIDFAGHSRRALTVALQLAEEADAHLTLLHAIEIPPELSELAVDGNIDVPAIRLAAEAAALRKLREMVPPDAHTYCKVHTDVREGRAYRQILQAAAERDADLIVMGVHAAGALDRLIFGTNAHAVVRAAASPLLVVRGLPAAPDAAKDKRQAVAQPA
jgi:nucleotide-binding universal stress UspA family protein